MSDIVRNRAIDPATSCLVQAPAGSGKTELLTRRILALLAIVDEPEEIVALTFTRKAAAEMGNRVIDALSMPEPEKSNAHKRETWQLAQQALARSEQRGWNLPGHPARLRIMTLDSLAGSLARQLPLLSGFGDTPAPSEHSRAACRRAAEKALTNAMRSDSDAAETLLLHQDHNSSNVIEAITKLLENRDQWLRHIAEHGRNTGRLRSLIEGNLAEFLNFQLHSCRDLIPVEVSASLPELIRFAGGVLNDEAMMAFGIIPACEASELPAWKIVADFLLTRDGQFKKRLDKNGGFPPDAKTEKQRMQELLQFLADVPGLADALDRIRSLPDSATFDAGQWKMVEALFELLPLAVTELQRIYSSEGQSDFTEISLRALEALNDPEGNPSDLLLRLDYRIRHILIDEFQDTSELQINLLHRLTAGWLPDDGRTLFMVGDPMQSIYRFRKAEVGYFLLAAKNMAGLPQVEPLQLERNFRSSPVIVDWVNRAFRSIFPDNEDAVSGAIAHADAVPALTHDGAVHLHLQQESDEAKVDDLHEAARVVELVQQARKDDSEVRIGILSRTRKHLHAIIPALHEAGILHRAINILPLHTRPEIRTMRALTRALLHPADNESWMALLRAPCCGLATNDLFALLHGDERPVSTIIFDEESASRLAGDATGRVQHLGHALAPCIEMSGRIELRRLVTVAWQRLGMPSLLDITAATNIETLLNLIESLEESGRIDFSLLDERIEGLFASPDVSAEAAKVELLTMHGAKGLQWDVVILPGMGKPPKNNDVPLIAFSEAPVNGQGLFLISPRAETGRQDLLFRLVQSIEQEKERQELARLLYVATTRAESELHMLGHLTKKGSAEKGSFLEMLLHDEEYFGAGQSPIPMCHDDRAPDRMALQRVALVPPPPPPCQRQFSQKPEYGWAGAEAAPIGIALHAVLQRIGETGIEKWESPNADDPAQLMTRILTSEGLSGKLLEKALKRCRQALEKTLASKMGRWILSGNHQDAHCEWEIWSEADGYLQQRFIDRSFIDDQNVRWIIDYKTGSHEGANLNAFLDNEADRYADQLSGYRRLLHELEPEREIRTALYFPVFDGWREIKVGSSGPL